MSIFHDITPLIAGSNWDHDGAWWFPFTLVWLLVLGGVLWLVLRARRPRAERTGIERASDILAERYARGELSVEEYRERLAELKSSA